MDIKPIPVAVTLGIGLILWFSPFPQGLDARSWHLFAIFVATLVGIVVRVLPMGAVGMLGIAVTALTGTLHIRDALSGFSNTTVWLVALVFVISRGFIKTGLGSRIAYGLVALLGKRTLGLGYGLIAADLVLAPAMPSNTARSGGVVFPVVQALADAFGSSAQKGTARRIGAFLALTAFQGSCITGAMFLTAVAGNPLVQRLSGNFRVNITWGNWALAALVPGLASLILVPLILYKLYPPEVKATPEAVKMARTSLDKLGPVKRSEWIMAGVLVMLLGLWIFGERNGIDATTTAMVGISVLLLSGVLTWDDVRKENAAWETLIWYAALVMMAGYLNSLGLIPYFTARLGHAVQGIPWAVVFILLSLVYFYSHYLFASNTAHISAMFAPFVAVMIGAGAPPLLSALVLGFFSSLFGGLTHYGTGPAQIFFGSDLVDLKDWLVYGLIVSVVNLVIWYGLGMVWWTVIGIV